MVTESIRTIFLRELRALHREIEAYPNEKDIWAVPAGIGNSAGTLALHLAGNLQHYLGARLGRTNYVRNRDAEFARRGVSRAEILEELDAANIAITRAFERISDSDLVESYPEKISGTTITTGEWLVHLVAHTGYHLGQIDYHRRLVTGDPRTVDVISVKELPSMMLSPVR
jgi:uncharacterized damage-inducible protein DinB